MKKSLSPTKRKGPAKRRTRASVPVKKKEALKSSRIKLTKKLKDENKKLQETVKRRTFELEQKNRELEIEAALEKVRSRTMAMRKSDELAEVVHLLFQQFKKLGENPDQATIGIINEKDWVIEYWVTMYGNRMDRVFKFAIDEPNVTRKIYDAWKERKKSLVIDLKGKELSAFMKYRASMGGAAVKPNEKRRIINVAFFSKGLLNVQSNESRSVENLRLLERFAHVFEQTYTRFLDLQKAEAQTREAGVELALERVRARTMAMHNSEELKEVIQEVYDQFLGLNINVEHAGFILDYKERDDMHIWLADHQQGVPSEITIPYFDSPHWNSYVEAKAKGENFFSNLLDFEEKNRFYKDLIALIPQMPEETVQSIFNKPGLTISTVLLDNVGLYIENYSGTPFTEEENAVLMRFGKVFQQTYTRFLDLQKAEAQAREAKIEAALERVRSKTMAMHSSRDVGESVATLFEELTAMKLLGSADRCGIGIMQPDEIMELWTAEKTEGGKTELTIGFLDLKPHPLLRSAYSGWVEKKEVNQYILEGEDKLLYYQAMQNQTQYKIKKDYYTGSEKIVHTDFYFNEGVLYVFSQNEFNEESVAVFIRFANVFGQTYRRYLDLQKAETQAREAKIEVALEKVRSRTMGMQSSNELPEVANLLFLEVQALGIPAWSCGYCILLEDKKSSTCFMSSEGTLQKPFDLPHSGEASFEEWDKFVQSEETFFTQELGDKAIESHYGFMKSLPQLAPIFKDIEGAGLSLPTYQINHLCKFSNGFMLFITYETVPDAHNIFLRFTKVFDQTYTRFLDLQKAEAQTTEAIRQASLDRVRGEIASMRTTDDLQRITPLIWRELITLGVPFFRCGVFIINENDQRIHAYLSTPEGKSLAVLHLPFDSNDTNRNAVEHWREQKVYTDHWDQRQFQAWAKAMMEQRQIEGEQQYQAGDAPPESLSLQFIPFKQGMLYVGSSEPLAQDQINLVKSLADAFSVAYARYEDFKQLEDAKNRVEATLTKLKATQSQLIQSEKMASLGELTAGIAHEIQNPLNFVNNFSEVSTELVDEMNEELLKGNTEDAKQIAIDLKQNLEKINHHGKRAGDIVKGMLQHSRSSSGVKEPTDINALADEYLRLAYHGLRAKDKSFNATMNTEFDESIGKINIVPQDIGRVILNLITNAFYVVNENKNSGLENYDPTVSVSTKKIDGKILISVKDNGNGIPDAIKEKIFQPFFTTKPTGQGTGLGLSLSYDIVKAHGGEIKIETKEGEGSEFIISLPIV